VVGLVFLFFVAPFSLLAVFRYASAFNQDVSNWNMDAVTTTTQMFQDAAAFADNTFFCAGSTNTGSWPTSVIRASDFVGSGVTDFSCSNTFLHNVMFKSVVDDWFGTNARKTAVQAAHGSIEDWDVSKITNMNSLFSGKTSFDNDLSKWNTSAVTRMASSKCSRFLSPSLWPRRLFRCGVLLNGQLEVRRVTSLTRFCSLCVCVCVVDLVLLFFDAPFSLLAVFYNARVFNQDVSTWNTGAVTTMYRSKCTLSVSLPVCVCGTLLHVVFF
jgi:surface protein